MTNRVSSCNRSLSFSVMLLTMILFPAMVGLGSLDAHAFSSKKPNANTAQSSSSSSSQSGVWVTRKDGATSCGIKKGETLAEGAAELKRNGVHILDSHKGNDGKMHALACGMPTGSTNAYLIPRADLVKAVSLGYEEAGR